MKKASLFVAVAAALGLAALQATAANPEAPAGPQFMASAPPADVTVEDVDGGARIVFKARDAKQVDALRAFARQLANHYREGCPMMGGGPGKGRGPGMGGAGGGMGGMACPNLASTPSGTAPSSGSR